MSGHPPVIVYPPSANGARRVTVRGRIVGLARGRGDVAAFLREAGFAEGVEEIDLDRSESVEWRGGDLDTWR
ncbi:hypothetical protein CP967_24200 [Streptomyces nitrosporeus]|uniref:Uncharacterized protein n=1 Tax=Streptomyces nitrosporeus TaxID=28894 RepID=A0A5J6FFF8_9ACTN|nr:hypothetical protein [Streptomyces nitrosporeus]QEU74676.1 hypothetical protein CP967_24200 [Streptomyces nitrosporeus]GGY85027.1 hypothetical protein GCM10010327_14330 [Streptomyces nitrosporeus]